MFGYRKLIAYQKAKEVVKKSYSSREFRVLKKYNNT